VCTAPAWELGAAIDAAPCAASAADWANAEGAKPKTAAITEMIAISARRACDM
jgi:hypothetical protein